MPLVETFSNEVRISALIRTCNAMHKSLLTSIYIYIIMDIIIQELDMLFIVMQRTVRTLVFSSQAEMAEWMFTVPTKRPTIFTLTKSYWLECGPNHVPQLDPAKSRAFNGHDELSLPSCRRRQRQPAIVAFGATPIEAQLQDIHSLDFQLVPRTMQVRAHAHGRNEDDAPRATN